jgi:hypothetical protein
MHTLEVVTKERGIVLRTVYSSVGACRYVAEAWRQDGSVILIDGKLA